jgi:integrase
MVDRKPLTHARQAELAKPEASPYNLNAGGGLFLKVMPNGSKRWQWRYFYLGKAKTLSMGLFPAVGLAEAKAGRDAAKKLLAQGQDPSAKRQEDKIALLEAHANTFEAVANEWLDRQIDKAASTQTKSRWLLQFAVDAFGHKPIAEITPRMVLDACRVQEDAGKLETAQRIKVKCGQVFRYAIAKGLMESDPTRDLRGQLKTPEVTHRAAITDPAKVGKLLYDIDQYQGQLETVCALKLAPLVFIRPGELRSARWADIDLDAALWSFTPPKTRKQTGVDHLVPLSRQALAILRELHAVNGRGEYVFRSSGKDGYLSENAVLAALRRMGYGKGEMTGHGFRAVARTLLAERLRYPAELIEQQLAHRVADVHGRAYNRTAFIEERTAMMQAWADYLDKLKTENTME